MEYRVVEQYSLGKDEYKVYNNSDEHLYTVKGQISMIMAKPLIVYDKDDNKIASIDPGHRGEDSTLWIINDNEEKKLAEVDFKPRGGKGAKAGLGWSHENNLITMDNRYFITKTKGKSKDAGMYKSSEYNLRILDKETEEEIVTLSRKHSSKMDMMGKKDTLFVNDINSPIKIFPIALAVIVDQHFFEKDEKSADNKLQKGLLSRFFGYLGSITNFKKY